MKRKLYLAPIYGLCNRLIMIASAMRICKQSNLELEIVWTDQDHPFSERRHFWGPLSSYFETDLLQSTFPLVGENVYMPKSMRQDRFVLTNSDLCRDSLYILNWTHAILKESDLTISKENLTHQINCCLRDLCKPSKDVIEYAAKHYPNGFILAKEKQDAPDFIGLHIRKGAIINTNDMIVMGHHDIPNFEIFVATLKVLRQTGIQKVFISSQRKEDTEELVALLNLHGIETLNHKTDHFPEAPLNNENQPEHITKAVCDFLGLANSRHVISSTASTFGAVAAMLTGNSRYIVSRQNNLVVANSFIMSGSGL